MTQGSLLDGKALKELGQARVEDAYRAWVEVARGAIRIAVLAKPTITAEDVEELTGPAPSPGAMGVAFSRAHAEGEITPIGYRPSLKPSRHRAIIRTWTLARPWNPSESTQEARRRPIRIPPADGSIQSDRADSGPNSEEVA